MKSLCQCISVADVVGQQELCHFNYNKVKHHQTFRKKISIIEVGNESLRW